MTKNKHKHKRSILEVAKELAKHVQILSYEDESEPHNCGTCQELAKELEELLR